MLVGWVGVFFNRRLPYVSVCLYVCYSVFHMISQKLITKLDRNFQSWVPNTHLFWVERSKVKRRKTVPSWIMWIMALLWMLAYSSFPVPCLPATDIANSMRQQAISDREHFLFRISWSDIACCRSFSVCGLNVTVRTLLQQQRDASALRLLCLRASKTIA